MNEKPDALKPIAEAVFGVVDQTWDKAERLSAFDKKQALIDWIKDTYVSQAKLAGDYMAIFSGAEGTKAQVELAFEVEIASLTPVMRRARVSFPSMLIAPQLGGTELITIYFNQSGGIIYPKDSSTEERHELERTCVKLAEAVVPSLQVAQLQSPDSNGPDRL